MPKVYRGRKALSGDSFVGRQSRHCLKRTVSVRSTLPGEETLLLLREGTFAFSLSPIHQRVISDVRAFDRSREIRAACYEI